MEKGLAEKQHGGMVRILIALLTGKTNIKEFLFSERK